MKPKIDQVRFGQITIEGTLFDRDVIILPDGKVAERETVDSASHVISLDEARQVWRRGAGSLIIGTGRFDLVELSDDAASFLKRKKCGIELQPTRKAVRMWNKAKGAAVGLFHITC